MDAQAENQGALVITALAPASVVHARGGRPREPQPSALPSTEH